MACVMRWFVVDRMPFLVLASVAAQPQLPQASPPLVGFPGRLADTGCPADMYLAAAEHVAVGADFGLAFEQRDRHALTWIPGFQRATARPHLMG
jgi:hypothetical protein